MSIGVGRDALSLHKKRGFIIINNIDIDIIEFHELDEEIDFGFVKEIEGILIEISGVLIGIIPLFGFFNSRQVTFLEIVHL